MPVPVPSTPAAPPALLIVRDLGGAVWKRRWIAGFCFVAVMAVVVAGIMLSPRVYQSEAKLYVRIGRESVSLDPTATTATTGQMLSVQDSRETELNSVVDVLSSRVILSSVVDRIGAATILDIPATAASDFRASGASNGPGESPNDTTNDPGNTPASLMTTLGLSDPIGQRELAVMALTKTVSVSANKKSNVVNVTAKASSPELAQKICSAVIDAFRLKHLQVNRTAGSYEFFKEQTAELRREFDAASEALTAARNALGVTNIGEKRTMIQAQVAALEADKLDAARTLAITLASLEATRQAIDWLPETVAAGTVSGSPNSAADRTRGNIADLRLREQMLLLKYTDNSPLVMAMREQIRRAEQVANELRPQSLQETMGPNPVRQAMESKLAVEQTQAASLQARMDTLGTQLTAVRSELENLNAHEGELAGLEQRRDVAAASYRQYAEKLEQARLDNEIGREQISNVNVFQPASYVARPVRPDKRLLFAAGLVFALAGAVSLAIGLEYLPHARAALRPASVIAVPGSVLPVDDRIATRSSTDTAYSTSTTTSRALNGTARHDH